MVEYLTGSTQLSWLVANPLLFFAFLAQNIGSYGLAVLLIREAKVRWHKGWATVLLLGAAYGILNEGIGAATLFNPNDAATLGIVATYGHWLGVNWVWATELVLIVHPIFSVSLPILLLDLALPEMRGKSLLNSTEIRGAFAGLAVDAIGTLVFVGAVRHFYAGPVLWAGSMGAMAALAGAAYFVRADLLRPTNAHPTTRPVTVFAFGIGFFALLTFGGDALASMGVLPVLIAFFFLALGALALLWFLRHLGREQNERTLVALCTALVAVLLPQGFFGQLGTGPGMVPVVAGDLLAVILLVHLWKKYERADRTRGEVAVRPMALA
jgi:MFS family permease